MKKILIMPILAFALFACESNETENEANLDEIGSSISQSNLWTGDVEPDTVTFNAKVTSIRDWDGVVLRYTALVESESEEGETVYEEVETETEVLKLKDSLSISNAFINPDLTYPIFNLDFIPYKVIGEEEGQLYEDAVEEITFLNGFALSSFTYQIELKDSYEQYIE